MAKKKKFIFIGIISGLVLILFTFAVNQNNENQQYERYISHKLVNNISILTSSVKMNNKYLNEVINGQQITGERLRYMKSNFEEVRIRGGEIIELAEYWLGVIEDEEHYVNPYPVYMASDFLFFLRGLDKDLDEGNILRLSSEQIEKFKLMKSVNSEWLKAIESSLEGINARSENLINSDDWGEMVNQMQRVSKQFESDVDMLFN